MLVKYWLLHIITYYIVIVAYYIFMHMSYLCDLFFIIISTFIIINHIIPLNRHTCFLDIFVKISVSDCCLHCVKIVRIRSYPGPCFSEFRHFLRSARFYLIFCVYSNNKKTWKRSTEVVEQTYGDGNSLMLLLNKLRSLP